MAIAGIPAIAAHRIVLLIAQVIIQLTLQCAFDHHLGQLAQQATSPVSFSPPVRARSANSRSTCSSAGDSSAGSWSWLVVSHWCLLRLWSYTVELQSRQGTRFTRFGF